MQIVIDIPEDEYNKICSGTFDTEGYFKMNLKEAFRNAILLPKGHGELIDRSKIPKAIPAEEDNCTGMGMTYDEMDAYNDGIDVMYSHIKNAPTIIEADKAESEE